MRSIIKSRQIVRGKIRLFIDILSLIGFLSGLVSVPLRDSGCQCQGLASCNQRTDRTDCMYDHIIILLLHALHATPIGKFVLSAISISLSILTIILQFGETG